LPFPVRKRKKKTDTGEKLSSFLVAASKSGAERGEEKKRAPLREEKSPITIGYYNPSALDGERGRI